MENKVKITGEKVVNGMFWSLAERVGAQGVHFIVSVVLARLLTPDDFGVVTLSATFTTILSVFVTSGLGKALVQKKDVDETDYTTALISNVAIGVILYLVVYLCAPFIAAFYRQDLLRSIIRVLGITLILGGVNSIQKARVSRAMQFKMFFKATLTGTVISAVVGIYMAMKGFGAWAIVAQYLTNQAIDTIFLWIKLKWTPRMKYSWERFVPLFSYGAKVYGANMLETLYNSLRALLIGRFYTSAELAFYARGRQLPALINNNTNNAIQAVMFPAYSRYADDRVRLKYMMKKALSVGSFIIFPAMVGLALVSEPLIILLYTAKWLPAVPFLKIACFVYALIPLHVVNMQAILAIGRSDISLRTEIIKKSVAVTVMVICVRISLFLTAFSAVPLGIFALIVNAWPVKRELSYPLSEQLRDAMPALLMSICMGICVWGIGRLPVGNLIKLILQMAGGFAVYCGIAKITGNKDYEYIKSYIKNVVLRKRMKNAGN